MRLLPSLLCLTLAACGKAPQPVESELVSYFHSFEQIIGIDTSDISAAFEVVNAPAIGVCYRWSNGDKHIGIDKVYWDKMTDLGREQLIFHELGHCAMYLDHINGLVQIPNTNARIPVSIMYMYWFGNARFYSDYRNGYLGGLRDGTPLQL